jgi:hypothetical protein
MSKINEAVAILKDFGLPIGQQNERSELILLALADLKEDSSWSETKQKLIGIHDIMGFMEELYNKKYAENTRETIRKDTIHQFIQAGIVVKNPDDPSRATNSPKTVYSITNEALDALRRYGTSDWQSTLQKFINNKSRLVKKYEKLRKKDFIQLDLLDGIPIKLSPGKHNELQKKVVEEFHKRFCPDAKLLYLGDTAEKLLHKQESILEELKIPITEHDKLPDIIFYDSQRNVLFLIEVVTSQGPVSPKRYIELEEMLENCESKRVYINAFPDFQEFKKHIDNIAWETEVWIGDNPDHMIHFNGQQFLNVYK